MSSYYQRKDAEDGTTTFNVTPAPYPVGSLGVQIALWIGIAIIGVPLVFVIIGLWMVPAGIYFALKLNRVRTANLARARARQPATIVLTTNQIAAQGHSYNLDDVKGFLVTHEDGGPSAERVHVVLSGAHAAGLNAGLQLNEEHRFVSYEASLQRVSDSRPVVLVGGLTRQTAEALNADLASAAKIKADAA